jgi:hypothetical protein
MRPKNHTLDRTQVHHAAADYLQAHLKFKDYKRKTSAAVLWSLLLAAAARITSLSDACVRLRDAPSDETARKALLATLPDYAEVQGQLNAALTGHLPKALRRHLQRLAIDLALIPYHGEPFRDVGEVYRAQARDGTSHFHAYATAYVVRKGQRYTVALTGVSKGEPLKDVVQHLLRQAASVGIRPIERQVEGRDDARAEAVRGYCAAVRSALADDGRPPLEASGLRLHDRLAEVAASLVRAGSHSQPG